MNDKINNKKRTEATNNATDNDLAINKKLDELIVLLSETKIDSEKAKVFKEKINQAIEGTRGDNENIEAFQKLDTENTSRADLLDEFSILLSTHNVDSTVSKNYLRAEKGANWVLAAISIVMITLGMAVIIMPAPDSFEIFTIFYFNINDGVTLMDLVSLLIVLSGIYLLIKSFYNNAAISKR